MKNFIAALFISLLFLCNTGCSKILYFFQNKTNSSVNIEKVIPQEPELLFIFKQAYPDIIFESQYYSELEDWKITVKVPQNETFRSKDFFWNNGSFLPEEELADKDKYWTLLYHYNYGKPLADPADFTPEQVEAMKHFGSSDNRKNGAGTPMFFFDFLYDSNSQALLEKQIKKLDFLKGSMNIHRRIESVLKVVEHQITEEAKTNQEVADFINEIKRNEAYYWRIIAGTTRKSFHSLGIAIDITPRSYNRKEVFWSWAKDKNPEGWMLTPLKDRWIPPQKVIDIFENNGFIWGGKWAIWDNMHFEYHPELILYSQYQDSLVQSE